MQIFILFVSTKAFLLAHLHCVLPCRMHSSCVFMPNRNWNFIISRMAQSLNRRKRRNQSCVVICFPLLIAVILSFACAVLTVTGTCNTYSVLSHLHSLVLLACEWDGSHRNHHRCPQCNCIWNLLIHYYVLFTFDETWLKKKQGAITDMIFVFFYILLCCPNYVVLDTQTFNRRDRWRFGFRNQIAIVMAVVYYCWLLIIELK